MTLALWRMFKNTNKQTTTLSDLGSITRSGIFELTVTVSREPAWKRWSNSNRYHAEYECFNFEDLQLNRGPQARLGTRPGGTVENLRLGNYTPRSNPLPFYIPFLIACIQIPPSPQRKSEKKEPFNKVCFLFSLKSLNLKSYVCVFVRECDDFLFG